VDPVVLEEVRVPRELNEDRYRLKAPTFTGEEAVEQFIQEFHDVMEVTQWPPRVALLKLRMALMDKAKPYGVGPDIDGILASLRARFGISAIDARARLQKLRHDPHTSLQEHATTVSSLTPSALRSGMDWNHMRGSMAPWQTGRTSPSMALLLGRFHSVQEDIGLSLRDATEGPQQRPSQGQGTVPPHVQELYETACDGYTSNGERQVMAKLLRRYNNVPHRGDHDVGLNRAVRHEVPLVVGAVLIRQPTRRLGPKKRKRDRGPPWNEYDWDQGQLQQKAGTPPEVVQNLRANPALAGNTRELQELQENLPGVVADVYRAKKEGR